MANSLYECRDKLELLSSRKGNVPHTQSSPVFSTFPCVSEHILNGAFSQMFTDAMQYKLELHSMLPQRQAAEFETCPDVLIQTGNMVVRQMHWLEFEHEMDEVVRGLNHKL